MRTKAEGTLFLKLKSLRIPSN